SCVDVTRSVKHWPPTRHEVSERPAAAGSRASRRRASRRADPSMVRRMFERSAGSKIRAPLERATSRGGESVGAVPRRRVRTSGRTDPRGRYGLPDAGLGTRTPGPGVGVRDPVCGGFGNNPRRRPVAGCVNAIAVEIWSDVVCPWCYIGKRRFEEGVRRYRASGGELDVDVTYRSFLLAPDTPEDFEGTSAEFLADRKGMPLAQVQQMQAQITQRSEEHTSELQSREHLV